MSRERDRPFLIEHFERKGTDSSALTATFSGELGVGFDPDDERTSRPCI